MQTMLVCTHHYPTHTLAHVQRCVCACAPLAAPAGAAPAFSRHGHGPKGAAMAVRRQPAVAQPLGTLATQGRPQAAAVVRPLPWARWPFRMARECAGGTCRVRARVRLGAAAGSRPPNARPGAAARFGEPCREKGGHPGSRGQLPQQHTATAPWVRSMAAAAGWRGQQGRTLGAPCSARCRQAPCSARCRQAPAKHNPPTAACCCWEAGALCCRHAVQTGAAATLHHHGAQTFLCWRVVRVGKHAGALRRVLKVRVHEEHRCRAVCARGRRHGRG